MELFSPRITVPALEPPSREVLNMAFGVGAGAVLGDKSRYRSHGTIVTAAWADGLHGRCLDFDTANPDSVQIPAAHTQLNFTTEDFSLVARVYPDTVVPAPLIFCRGRANTDGWYMLILATGELEMDTHPAGPRDLTQSAAGAIVAGAWYTVGFSRTGTAVTLFINGVDATVVSGVHADPATCARIGYIGAYDGGGLQGFDGKMEFLRIWRHVALAASEHLAWHNALS